MFHPYSMASTMVGHEHDEQPPTFTKRVYRALCHHLRLLHRSGPTFHVLGATGNVYTVTLSDTPTCTCPDRVIPCKHILFVLLRVLSLPLHHPSLRRPSLLRPSLLLSLPTSPDSLAGPRTRQRFHQLFAASSAAAEASPATSPASGEGELCPVCLEEMGDREKVVVRCGVCRNGVHEECFSRWKRSGSGRRAGGVTCVICRARWRDGRELAGRYVNLAAYAQEEDDHGDYCTPLLRYPNP